MKHPAFVYTAGLLVLLTAGVSCMTEPSPYVNDSGAVEDRTQWAAAVDAPGLENFHRVSPMLYRGAQPTAEGFRELQKRGIKTIVNLRAFHSDESKVDDAGLTDHLKLERIYFKSWHVEAEDIEKFLAIVTDPDNQPVFVHCMHGSDRTGIMCAVYRIAVQHWTPDQANDEFIHGDYGFHAIWQNLPNYLGNLTDETLARWRALAIKKNGR
ncbi:MAG TPA: tyrosine-protein phosphatase [Planctomycetota bacterium]|nr:tyrosine-protein phosphatase [Planctomycetota bacterium]